MTPPIKSYRRLRSEEKKSAQTKNAGGALPEFRVALTDWFRREGRDLPWRRTRDPYAILVSEIMLQQTQVVTVIDYYRRWMERFPDADALASAGESDVLHAWQGLGYYSRARNLHAAAKRIVQEHGGFFPRDHAEIRALPGVGRYTAGAVATFAFDQPTPPVDGNIVRVIARLTDFRDPVDTGAGLERIWETAESWQPESEPGVFNEALMELGAMICTPRLPGCLGCPVRPFCAATEPELLPVKKPRRKTVLLTEHCGWVIRGGAVLLEQQTGTRWRGLWRLPLLPEEGESAAGRVDGPVLLTLDYPFTHHRITLKVYSAPADSIPAAGNRQWFPLADLGSVPMPAPHRRALKQLTLKPQAV